jgi:hypothetical protein
MAFRCQPRSFILSPISITFTTLGSREANATTEAGGEPRTYSDGIFEVMASAMRRAAVTIERQDSR